MILRSVRYMALMVAISMGLGGCLEPLGRPPYNHSLSARYPGLCRLGQHPGGDASSYWCERTHAHQ
jgi:hypothetical protein